MWGGVEVEETEKRYNSQEAQKRVDKGAGNQKLLDYIGKDLEGKGWVGYASQEDQ